MNEAYPEPLALTFLKAWWHVQEVRPAILPRHACTWCAAKDAPTTVRVHGTQIIDCCVNCAEDAVRTARENQVPGQPVWVEIADEKYSDPLLDLALVPVAEAVQALTSDELAELVHESFRTEGDL